MDRLKPLTKKDRECLKKLDFFRRVQDGTKNRTKRKPIQHIEPAVGEEDAQTNGLHG